MIETVHFAARGVHLPRYQAQSVCISFNRALNLAIIKPQIKFSPGKVNRKSFAEIKSC